MRPFGSKRFGFFAGELVGVITLIKPDESETTDST